jgi:hypothetical protein
MEDRGEKQKAMQHVACKHMPSMEFEPWTNNGFYPIVVEA